MSELGVYLMNRIKIDPHKYRLSPNALNEFCDKHDYVYYNYATEEIIGTDKICGCGVLIKSPFGFVQYSHMHLISEVADIYEKGCETGYD